MNKRCIHGIATHGPLRKTLLLSLWPVAEYLLSQTPVLQLPSSIESAFKKIMVHGALKKKGGGGRKFSRFCLVWKNRVSLQRWNVVWEDIAYRCSLYCSHLYDVISANLSVFHLQRNMGSVGSGIWFLAPAKWFQLFESVSVNCRFASFYRNPRRTFTLLCLQHTIQINTVYTTVLLR